MWSGAADSALTAADRVVRRTVVARLADAGWRLHAAQVAATFALLAFVVRVLGAAWPGRFRIFFPDSFSFVSVARLTPLSPRFYVAERPVAFPILLFLLGRSTVVTVVVQTMLYGAAYLIAAFVLWRLLRETEARIVGAFLVISVGLEPRFALWNTHILSESFGMTLAVGSVLSWWRFAVQPGRTSLHLAGASTVAWLTVRDSNVPPWAVVGVPALLLASWLWTDVGPRLRRNLRRWGVATLLVCVGVGLGQADNGRNRYATMNNVGTRVLADRALTRWFADHGMPLDDALRARTGTNSFDHNWDMLVNPDLQTFRDWADNGGQRLMLLSYARFAPHWTAALYEDLPILLRADHSGYDAFGVIPRLPGPMPGQVGGPTTRRGLLAWSALAVGSLAVAAGRRRRVEAVVLALLLVSTFVDLYMAYVGDSVEVQRHMVGPMARMALVLVLCVAVGLDGCASWLRDRGGDRGATRTPVAARVSLPAGEPDVESGVGLPLEPPR